MALQTWYDTPGTCTDASGFEEDVGSNWLMLEEPPAPQDVFGGPSPHWLLRLGTQGRFHGADPSPAPNGRSLRPGGGDFLQLEIEQGSTRRILMEERARHAILSWRLRRPYLVYCLCCSTATAFLLGWNVFKGVKNNWNLPQWKHHKWEEAMEVSIGVFIVAETLLTIRVVGLRAFFHSWWFVFDFGVALLTVVSIFYGLKHLGREGELCEADLPLLLLRFVLQPSRALAACVGTYRTHHMQNQVDELQVDFGALARSHENNDEI